VRDWLEVFRQTFFGITQDFDDGLTVDEGTELLVGTTPISDPQVVTQVDRPSE
jgi:hypothetical protein